MVPAAYVELEALPVTANGKLDRGALPEPEGRAHVSRIYEAPIGEIEQTLADSWAKWLGVECVGRHDDFFELGGQSLLALKTLGLLKRFWPSKRISMAELFECRTIRSLAERLRSDILASSVIRVRTSGSDRPLFLVHEVHGSDAYFPILGKHIHHEIPVYGLPAADLEAPPLHTMAELAARLVRLIAGVQPAGPYRVAGWSFGGVLAYEVASQLIAIGERVEFVGLLDTSYESAGYRQIRTLADALRVALDPLLTQAQRTELWERFAHIDDHDFDALLRESQRRFAGALDHLSAFEFRKHCARLLGHARAVANYTASAIGAPVHLFRALEELEQSDPLLGWATVLPRHAITVTPVPGDHRSMLTPPHVARLGQSMSRILMAQQTRTAVL
jgi:arthrofactin-type cyclic lipopeptide synthetase C